MSDPSKTSLSPDEFHIIQRIRERTRKRTQEMAANPGNEVLFQTLNAEQNGDWEIVDKIFALHGLPVKMGEFVDLLATLQERGLITPQRAVEFIFGAKVPTYIQ